MKNSQFAVQFWDKFEVLLFVLQTWLLSCVTWVRNKNDNRSEVFGKRKMEIQINSIKW
jgi:hypothetical protein